MEDRRVIACNYRVGTNIAPEGALAFVSLLNPGGGHDQIVVVVRSHSGRWVQKWERIHKLTNFRLKTLPPGHPLYPRDAIWDAQTGDVERLSQAAGRELIQRTVPPLP